MPVEITLLSDVEPGSALMADVAEARYPGAAVLEYRGAQIRQVVDAAGTALLMVYRGRPIGAVREVAYCLRGVPGVFALWIDMAIPFGAPAGRELAEAIARAVGGAIYDRV
jgi:hypothetical protein